MAIQIRPAYRTHGALSLRTADTVVQHGRQARAPVARQPPTAAACAAAAGRQRRGLPSGGWVLVLLGAARPSQHQAGLLQNSLHLPVNGDEHRQLAVNKQLGAGAGGSAHERPAGGSPEAWLVSARLAQQRMQWCGRGCGGSCKGSGSLGAMPALQAGRSPPGPWRPPASPSFPGCPPVGHCCAHGAVLEGHPPAGHEVVDEQLLIGEVLQAVRKAVPMAQVGVRDSATAVDRSKPGALDALPS